MIATKIIEVQLTEAEYEAALAKAAQMGRTIGEYAGDAIRSYEDLRKIAGEHMGILLDQVREKAALNRMDNISMEEIDEEIAAARRERNQLARSA